MIPLFLSEIGLLWDLGAAAIVTTSMTFGSSISKPTEALLYRRREPGIPLTSRPPGGQPQYSLPYRHVHQLHLTRLPLQPRPRQWIQNSLPTLAGRAATPHAALLVAVSKSSPSHAALTPSLASLPSPAPCPAGASQHSFPVSECLSPSSPRFYWSREQERPLF